MRRVALGVVTLVLAGSAERVHAQGSTFELGVGVSVPAGTLAKSDALWKTLRLGVTQRRPESLVRFRLEADMVWGAQSAASSGITGVRAFGFGYSALIAKQRHGLYPYVTLGLGASWVPELYLTEIIGSGDALSVNVYSVSSGTQYVSPRLGTGVRGTIGRIEVHAEVGLTGFVSGAFGASSGYLRAGYVPITAGVSF
jgi:hypothetical protein